MKRRPLKIWPLAVVAVLLGLGLAATQAPKILPTLVQPLRGRKVGLQSGTIAWAGITRNYLVYIPPTPAVTTTLLVVLHGSGGTGKSIAQTSGFDTIAPSAYAVYPESIGSQFNDASPSGTDDLGFLNALIQKLTTQYTITRTFAAGYSNGAGMASALALKYPALLSGLATVAGGLTKQEEAWLGPPHTPLAVISFHGTADTIWPYAGGPDLLGAVANATTWGTVNGCTVDSGLQVVPATGGSVTVDTFSGCAQTSQLYTLIGAGHIWPGSRTSLPGLGPTNPLPASQLIWTFIQAH